VAIFYVDGKFMPAKEAVIPVDDLAILRGYGVFDFMRTYRGKPIFLKEHIERLQKSAQQIGLELPWSQTELSDIVTQTLARNNFAESNIRIVVTGGSSPDFITPQKNPRLLVLVTALPKLPAEWYSSGIKIISIDSARNIPGAKSIDYIPATIALREVRRRNAVEAVYVDRGGYLLEGTTSNLFVFSEGLLATPGRAILNGITRKIVIELAQKFYTLEIRDIHRDELSAAQEAFITGSNKEIVPVIQFDDICIGNGKPGQRTRQIMDAFSTFTADKAESA
jgi:branched-chain amino acid aminotransferase